MMLSMRMLGVAVAVLLFSMPGMGQGLSAKDALSKVRERYPAKLPVDTVDTVKAGDTATTVTGVATTFLDTLDVLREASRRGLNLVITHEPTFYNHRDETATFADDPVYLEKAAC